MARCETRGFTVRVVLGVHASEFSVAVAISTGNTTSALFVLGRELAASGSALVSSARELINASLIAVRNGALAINALVQSAANLIFAGLIRQWLVINNTVAIVVQTITNLHGRNALLASIHQLAVTADHLASPGALALAAFSHLSFIDHSGVLADAIDTDRRLADVIRRGVRAFGTIKANIAGVAARSVLILPTPPAFQFRSALSPSGLRTALLEVGVRVLHVGVNSDPYGGAALYGRFRGNLIQGGINVPGVEVELARSGVGA